MTKKALLIWKSITIVLGLAGGLAIVVFSVATADYVQYWAIAGGVLAVVSAVLFAMVDSSEAQARGKLADIGLLVAHCFAIVAAFIAFGLLFNIASR